MKLFTFWKRKKVLASLLFLVVIFFVFLFFFEKRLFIFGNDAVNSMSRKNETQDVKGYHTVGFFDKELFFKAVSDLPEGENEKYTIKGGIIPHHLLPGFIIADFFNHFSQQDIETVILVGPNHEERGGHNIITGKYGWETPLGTIDPELNIIDDLTEKKIVAENEDAIEDHSITGILLFVKYYFPKAKIVPLILSKKINESDIDFLSSELSEYLKNEKTILVASVDFSHNLTNFEAKSKDKESLEVIKDRKYDRLFSFGNEYMDSPASIALLLKTMDNINFGNFNILNNTNSGELTGDNFLPSTSYFSFIFFK